MINILKELQEAIPYEDLCKYTTESLDKTAEEILKSHEIEVSDFVAEECYDYVKDINIMTVDELSMITDGEENGAKWIINSVKISLIGGRKTSAPPVGSVLKFLGINSSDFFNEFNARTKEYEGEKIQTVINVYVDHSFSFTMKSPITSARIMHHTPKK